MTRCVIVVIMVSKWIEGAMDPRNSTKTTTVIVGYCILTTSEIRSSFRRDPRSAVILKTNNQLGNYTNLDERSVVAYMTFQLPSVFILKCYFPVL